MEKFLVPLIRCINGEIVFVLQLTHQMSHGEKVDVFDDFEMSVEVAKRF